MKTPSIRNEMVIELCGEQRLIRADFECLNEIETRICGIYPLMYKFSQGQIKIAEVAVVLWCGLKAAGEKNEDDKLFTLKEVQQLCFKHGYVHLVKFMGEFLALGMSGDEKYIKPKSEGEETKNDQAT